MLDSTERRGELYFSMTTMPYDSIRRFHGFVYGVKPYHALIRKK
jgi:hypothetical protein